MFVQKKNNLKNIEDIIRNDKTTTFRESLKRPIYKEFRHFFTIFQCFFEGYIVRFSQLSNKTTTQEETNLWL